MSVKSSTVARSDLSNDEFISCENCLILFEKSEIEHGADNGTVCHHTFCRPCIKSQIGSDSGVLAKCPVCKFSKKKSEKQKMPFSSNPDWCSSCNIAAHAGCRKEKHVIQSINNLFVGRSQKLKILIDQTNLACDDTLKDFNDIHSVHQVILSWIGWLQQKISQWNSSNTATIAQLESLKTTVRFHIPPQEDMSSTINQLNQMIAEFNGKYQLAKTIQSKGSNLIQTYRNAKLGSSQSAQTSSATESLPLLSNWFSTALSHDHKSCRDILSFLVRLLNKEESVTASIPAPNCSNSDVTLLSKQNNPAKDDSSLKVDTETVLKKGIQPVQKRQLEEVSGSRTPISKKARPQNPDRRDDEQLHPNFSQSAVSLALKEVQVITGKKKLTLLTRKLQDAESKLKLSEEKLSAFTKDKARQLIEKEIPSVRLETDLTLHVEKVELTEDPKAKTDHDSSILLKIAKTTRENYEMVLILSTADVEQLHLVRKLLDHGHSKVAIVLQERTNQTVPKGSEKPLLPQESAEKRCHQLQKQVEEIKKALEKSTTELREARLSKDQLLLEKAQMQEEVRNAKEESQKLQSKMIAAEAKYVQELSEIRIDKTQLEWLEMQWLQKMDELTKIREQNEHEDNLKNANRLPQSSQQRFTEMQLMARLDKVWQILQVTPVMLEVQPTVSNVITQERTKTFHVYNFNAMAELIVMELISKRTSLLYHSCVGCRSLVDTRYYCNQCPNVIFCIPCYQKEKHCHEMEILGFDLDVQKLPANCKIIEEARNSRVGRRIDAFLHCLQCSYDKCRIRFCRPLKLMIEHCPLCNFQIKKSTTESSFDSKSMCIICAELVALIIYHAKLCNAFMCRVPHCFSGKRWIRDINRNYWQCKSYHR